MESIDDNFDDGNFDDVNDVEPSYTDIDLV